MSDTEQLNERFNDPATLTAMVLSDGVIAGLEGAMDAFHSVVFRHESALTSTIATLSRLKLFEIVVLKSLAESSGLKLDSVTELGEKITTAVILNNIVSGLLTKEEAAILLPDEKMVHVFEAAERAKNGAVLSESESVEILNSYLCKK